MHVMVFLIALPPGVDSSALQAHLEASAETVHGSDAAAEVQSRVHRPADPDAEWVWVIRFDEAEFHRVTRANWPFLITQVADVLREVTEKFAVGITSISGSETGLEQLVDDWNAQFGRFKKLSL